MQQITAPLADLPDDPVAAAANQDFPVVLRGYDRVAVDAYVKRITQLVAELYATRSPEGAVRRALERVGGEVSAILQRAHETADQITSQSRSEAEDRLARAREEADAQERSAQRHVQQIEEEAQRRVQELDADVDRIWAERDKIIGDVRRLSEELAGVAGAAGRRFAPEQPPERPALSPDFGEQELQDDEVGPFAGQSQAVNEPEPLAPEEESLDEQEEPGASDSYADEYVGPAEPLSRDEYVGPAQPLSWDRSVGEEEPFAADEPFSDQGLEEIAAHETARLPVEAAADAPAAGERVFAEEPTAEHAQLRRPSGSDARVIDLMHLGRERVIGCWQVGDVLIDPGPGSCLPRLLAALGDQRPRALLLTHIHLDHAGASGALTERWPDIEVYVHERGAPHLMDPSRLLESARRLYGADMDRLWGEVVPVPAENIRLLRGGERLLEGAFEVVYTPGHASHHVSYLHDETAFVGDTGGVRITPHTLTIPPTPPPDVDVEAWHQSINRVLAWKPRRLAITHFGSSEDVEEQLNELSERLDNLAALAHTEDEETFVATVREEIERDAGPELLPTYTQAAPQEQLYAGLRRYWDKRAEDESAARSAPAEASTHAGRFHRPGGS